MFGGLILILSRNRSNVLIRKVIDNNDPGIRLERLKRSIKFSQKLQTFTEINYYSANDCPKSIV
jgi:hypothetical protein